MCHRCSIRRKPFSIGSCCTECIRICIVIFEILWWHQNDKGIIVLISVLCLWCSDSYRWSESKLSDTVNEFISILLLIKIQDCNHLNYRTINVFLIHHLIKIHLPLTVNCIQRQIHLHLSWSKEPTNEFRRGPSRNDPLCSLDVVPRHWTSKGVFV